jgi:hypothetical protein
MVAKDQIQLARWLQSRASLDEVLHAPSTGLAGNERFSERARRAYVLAWTWSADRFHGVAGAQQDVFYKRHGLDALKRRIERCRRFLNRNFPGSIHA